MMADMEADDGDSPATSEETNTSRSSSNLVHPWPYLQNMFSFVEKRGESYIMQCKLCVPKKSNISAYKNSTSNLRKHVEVSHVSRAFPGLNWQQAIHIPKTVYGTANTVIQYWSSNLLALWRQLARTMPTNVLIQLANNSISTLAC